MVGILIVTHADLGKGVLNATELIAGTQENIEVLGLYHGDSVDKLCEQVGESIKTLNTGDGILVFVDFLGGSPANVTLKCLQEENFPCVTGVNMPMLLEAVTNRAMGVNDANQLKELCLSAGKDGILELATAFEEISAVSDDVDDF